MSQVSFLRLEKHHLTEVSTEMCEKRENVSKATQRCFEAGKFHCNFVRQNNVSVGLSCRRQPYLYCTVLCKSFLSQQAREELRNGPYFA